MREFLTICIPTYKRAKLLDRCLNEYFSSPHEEVQILVGNNASPDDTSEVLEKFKDCARFSYYRNEENIGGERNLLKLIGQVKTRFFMILTDDDFVDHDGLDALLFYLVKFPNVGAVISPLFSVTEEKRIVHIRGKFKRIKIIRPGLISAFKYAQFGWAWSRLVFARNAFDLQYAQQISSNCYCIVEMLGKICRNYDLLLIPDRIVFHTIGNEVFWDYIDPNVVDRTFKVEKSIAESLGNVLQGGGILGNVCRAYFQVRVIRQYLQHPEGFHAYIRKHNILGSREQNLLLAQEFGIKRFTFTISIIRLWAEIHGALYKVLRRARSAFRK